MMAVVAEMSGAVTEWCYPDTDREIIIIVGGFGSGKTEVAVNLAAFFMRANRSPVTLVDLDLVNPYFRSREAKNELTALGIEMIAPEGGKFYADLPILLPRVRGLIEAHSGLLILDVGGDAQGARALGSMAGLFAPDGYEMLMVLNSRRPQTSDAAGCLKAMSRVETAASLKFTGLIANSHMIDETEPEVVLEGYRLVREVSEKTGLPIFAASAKKSVLDRIDRPSLPCPVLPLSRSLLKPWERKEKSG